jgi:hypothetical protein
LISGVQAFANVNTKVMLVIPTGFCAPIISDALTGLVDGVPVNVMPESDPRLFCEMG